MIETTQILELLKNIDESLNRFEKRCYTKYSEYQVPEYKDKQIDLTTSDVSD